MQPHTCVYEYTLEPNSDSEHKRPKYMAACTVCDYKILIRDPIELLMEYGTLRTRARNLIVAFEKLEQEFNEARDQISQLPK